MTVVSPLDVRNAGFILTFGATAALLESASRLHPQLRADWSAWARQRYRRVARQALVRPSDRGEAP